MKDVILCGVAFFFLIWVIVLKLNVEH